MSDTGVAAVHCFRRCTRRFGTDPTSRDRRCRTPPSYVTGRTVLDAVLSEYAFQKYPHMPQEGLRFVLLLHPYRRRCLTPLCSPPLFHADFA